MPSCQCYHFLKFPRARAWASALDNQRRTLLIVDAYRDGNRFVVRAGRWGWKPPFARIELTLSASGGQDCTRAKSVGRLPQELHLTLFPQGKTRTTGSLAKLEIVALRIRQNVRWPKLCREDQLVCCVDCFFFHKHHHAFCPGPFWADTTG